MSSLAGLRVAVIHPRYTPFGGGARMIDAIVGCLAGAGARVTLVVRSWSGTRPDGVDIRIVDPPYLGSTWRDVGFARAATTRLAGDFDLVVSDQKLAGIDVYIAGGGVHTVYVAERLRRAGWLARVGIRLNPHTRWLARAEAALFASSRLQAVVCVSQRVRDDIVAGYAVDPSRLHVVYNGIDLARFDPAWRDAHRAHLRREQQLGDRFTLAFVGGGMENKGLPTVLRAMARSGVDAELLVVGRDRHLPRFRRLAEDLGLGARCRFAGPQADVRPWYAMADVTVLASYFETFGLVCLESMAMGVPVLVSSRAGVAELVDDGVHGRRVDPDDVDDVARGLRLLAAEHRRLGPACVARARAHGLDAMSLGLQSVLANLRPRGTAAMRLQPE